MPRKYPAPKCLCKQGTMNTNIIKERKMSSTGINWILTSYNLCIKYFIEETKIDRKCNASKILVMDFSSCHDISVKTT